MCYSISIIIFRTYLQNECSRNVESSRCQINFKIIFCTATARSFQSAVFDDNTVYQQYNPQPPIEFVLPLTHDLVTYLPSMERQMCTLFPQPYV